MAFHFGSGFGSGGGSGSVLLVDREVQPVGYCSRSSFLSSSFFL